MMELLDRGAATCPDTATQVAMLFPLGVLLAVLCMALLVAYVTRTHTITIERRPS